MASGSTEGKAVVMVPPPSATTVKPDVVVAKDGRKNAFKTVNEAVAARGPANQERFVIYVAAGEYNENVIIKGSNVTLVGDGIGKTILSGSRSVKDGFRTFTSATLVVEGDGFIGGGFTVRNTAGAEKGQAVAMRSSCNHAAFYQCSFEGYQDTLYVYSGVQFFRECYIYGTVDFIFSARASVVFQKCNIYARNPGRGKANTITADGREGANDPWGICMHNCRVLASPELTPALGVKTYLGRPWRDYSRTVFMTTAMGSLVDPAGWLAWDGAPHREATVYYAEYNNSGPGAPNKALRVKWPGYHLLDDNPAEASKFTVAQFIDGNDWLPATGVPFDAAL